MQVTFHRCDCSLHRICLSLRSVLLGIVGSGECRWRSLRHSQLLPFLSHLFPPTGIPPSRTFTNLSRRIGHRQIHHHRLDHVLWIHVQTEQSLLVLQRISLKHGGDRAARREGRTTGEEVLWHVRLNTLSLASTVALICWFRMSDALKTVSWSLFGLAEKEGVQMKDFDKQFTKVVSHLIYGAFNSASVIVLLNVLIAIMSKLYEAIEEHADVERKFIRCKL